MSYTTVGVDIAKNVMQMHWVGFCRSKAVCYAQGVKTNDVIDEAEPESNRGARA
jgi:hypothetical protein